MSENNSLLFQSLELFLTQPELAKSALNRIPLRLSPIQLTEATLNSNCR